MRYLNPLVTLKMVRFKKIDDEIYEVKKTQVNIMVSKSTQRVLFPY